jgi:hypothetical protein
MEPFDLRAYPVEVLEKLALEYFITGSAWYNSDRNLQENNPDFLLDQNSTIGSWNFRRGASGDVEYPEWTR